MQLDVQMDMINKSAQNCESILSSLVNDCCIDLDNYVNQIRDNFSDISKVDNLTLDNFILNLPILIYYANSRLERLGLKGDLSSIERKRQIVNKMMESNGKTKSENQTISEINSADIIILDEICDRAYKIVKSKIDTAYEILASCKKIMSRRIEELKTEQSDTGRQKLHS